MLEFGHMVSTDEIFECRTHTPIRLNLALNGNIAGPLPAKIGKPCAKNAKIVKAENRGNEAWSAVKTNNRSHGAATALTRYASVWSTGLRAISACVLPVVCGF